MQQFPHLNPLPKPELLVTPTFEELLQSVKTSVVEYVRQSSPSEADAIQQTLDNPAEILTKTLEAMTVFLQNHTRQFNDKALQMFGMYARDNDVVDVIVSSLNVERQILDPGDPNATPPVPATVESNESLLTRYYLAAYALATTGTRLGYRYHLMTLDDRPQTSVESPTPNQVLVTYDFPESNFSGVIKDAQVRQVSPGVVDAFILTHEGNGRPSQELIDRAQQYITRPDIGQETDLVTVKAPTIIPWNLRATIFVAPGADPSVRQQGAEQAAMRYADEQNRLEGRIEPSALISLLISNSGAFRAEITEPAAPIVAAFNEAPRLGTINITFVTE